MLFPTHLQTAGVGSYSKWEERTVCFANFYYWLNFTFQVNKRISQFKIYIGMKTSSFMNLIILNIILEFSKLFPSQ